MMLRRKWEMSERARQLILSEYDGSYGCAKRLSEKLAIPKGTVQQWANKLRYPKESNYRLWTQEEIAYLEEHIHHMSIEDIAKKLNRTEKAVLLRKNNLGLRKDEAGYTQKSLSVHLGCTAYRVAQWRKRGWLKGERRNSRRKPDMWYFSEKDVEDFIQTHGEEIERRRVKLGGKTGIEKIG